jgi:hypothetical protein
VPWDLQGNGGIGANNWLGTRNAQPLIIRTENATAAPIAGTEVMRFTPAANGRRVGIGAETPQRKLHVYESDLPARCALEQKRWSQEGGGLEPNNHASLRMERRMHGVGE